VRRERERSEKRERERQEKRVRGKKVREIKGKRKSKKVRVYVRQSGSVFVWVRERKTRMCVWVSAWGRKRKFVCDCEGEREQSVCVRGKEKRRETKRYINEKVWWCEGIKKNQRNKIVYLAILASNIHYIYLQHWIRCYCCDKKPGSYAVKLFVVVIYSVPR
jgi:hypothetical protein